MGRCGSWDCDHGASSQGCALKRVPAPAPFLTKTYSMVDDPATDHIVSWGDGAVSSLIVWRPAEFARDILPTYFKHNNFTSFVRQLNSYGFRKLAPGRWEYANEFFRKGNKPLLCEVQRRKMVRPTAPPPTPPFFDSVQHFEHFQSAPRRPHQQQLDVGVVCAAAAVNATPGFGFQRHRRWRQTSPPAASPSASTRLLFPGAPPSPSPDTSSGRRASCPSVLMEENERLRRSNTALLQELAHTRQLYNDVISLLGGHPSRAVPTKPAATPLHGLMHAAAPVAINYSGGSNTSIGSHTIDDEPSPHLSEDGYKAVVGRSGRIGTERPPATLLFGVQLSVSPSGTKRTASPEEDVGPVIASPHAARKRKLGEA